MILLQTNWNLLIPVLIIAAIVIFLIFRMYKMRHLLTAGLGPETSEYTKELTDQNFAAVIKKGVTLVDFWAPWCSPCRIQGPIVNDLANEIKNKAQICKMDVDKNQNTARKYGIRSIPTILIFKDGNIVKQLVGVKTKSQLLKELEPFIQ